MNNWQLKHTLLINMNKAKLVLLLVHVTGVAVAKNWFVVTPYPLYKRTQYGKANKREARGTV